MDGSNFLTRDEIDTILHGMTARDIFAAMPEGGEAKGNDIAGRVFEAAASRQGHGEGTLDRVRPQDAVYLAGALGEVFAQDSPKGVSTDPLPDSSDTGELIPS